MRRRYAAGYRGAFAFTHLREHIIPRNRKILRHQFDHALGSTQSRLRVDANISLISAFSGSYWNASMCTDTLSSTAVISVPRNNGNLPPAKQPTHPANRRSCHDRQSQHHAIAMLSLPATTHAAFPYRRKKGMAVNVPTFSGRCRSAYANHVSIVSCFWRDSAQYRVN